MLFHQRLAVIPYLGCGRIFFRIEFVQGAQPTIAVGRMNCLVGPIEVHVVFARLVADFFEDGRSLRFASDIFGLKEIEHSKAINWFGPFRAFVDVGSERHF